MPPGGRLGRTEEVGGEVEQGGGGEAPEHAATCAQTLGWAVRGGELGRDEACGSLKGQDARWEKGERKFKYAHSCVA